MSVGVLRRSRRWGGTGVAVVEGVRSAMSLRRSVGISAPRATPRAYSCGVLESHDLEVDEESYQRGLQDGRAARARARELGAESDCESNAQPSAGSRGQREAYLRGYRAGLSD